MLNLLLFLCSVTYLAAALLVPDFARFGLCRRENACWPTTHAVRSALLSYFGDSLSNLCTRQ